jgi:hypothetical protein
MSFMLHRRAEAELRTIDLWHLRSGPDSDASL